MHHIIDIYYKLLLCIYRSGLVFCFALSMACRSGRSADQHNKSKKLPTEGVDSSHLYALDRIDAPIKKVKKLKKRVASVPEEQQAIVLLHGLHRAPYDFEAMKAALKQKFPRAIVVALASVAKDLHKKKGSSSPTMDLSIKKQAELAYEEIKKKVGCGKHLVLVGHSQGGLRGFTLVKQHRHRLKEEDGILISQLITIGTPWKGAPVMDHIKHPKAFKETLNKIKPTLEAIQKNYSKAIERYFFKVMPILAKVMPILEDASPRLYAKSVPPFMAKQYPGVADLALGSAFICDYVASGIKEVGLPITAIAGVLMDFSKLFEPFPSIGAQALAELNATYATLIGGDPRCAHDMLLPVATQHAEGLVKKDFKCIKVYGACHGNKVGVSVKCGLSELNNKEVIQRVVESIEEAFYEEKEETLVEEAYPPAA